MKRHVPLVLKVCFAAGILTWLARGGKLNFAEIGGALSRPLDLTVILLVIYLQIAVTAWRWKLLLQAQGFEIGLRQAFRLNMIGSLFNMVIPGSVGGDVMKAYYVARGEVGRKTEVVATILLDRIVGVMGLLVLAAVVALWNLRSAAAHPALMTMSLFAIAGAAGSLTAMALGVKFGSRLTILSRSGNLRRVLTCFEAFRKTPTVLPIVIFVSMLCHLSVSCAIYLAMRALSAPRIPLHYFLLAAPLGLLATAIPLAPAGIGVGQVAFLSLFQIVVPGSAPGAVNALTVYQSLALVACLSGFVPYLLYKDANGLQYSKQAAAVLGERSVAP